MTTHRFHTFEVTAGTKYCNRTVIDINIDIQYFCEALQVIT